MRVAWLTPWPPQPSGIAGTSAAVVPALAARGHGIDVFVDERLVRTNGRAPDAAPAAGEVRVQGAHEFLWRQARGQYDLAVYQLGNSRLHDFVWPYLVRAPGLVVLHDARLHHARARALLRAKRADDYRAEFAWNHPDAPAAAAELAVAGFGGVYLYQWPMTRAVIASARLVASHSKGTARALAEEWPDRPIEYIALSEQVHVNDLAEARSRFRAAYGLADAVVFGVFGALTAERRLGPILRAFAAARARCPQARLLLAGEPDPAVKLPDLAADLGLSDAIVLLGRADAETFDAAIAAADVSLNLRWPSTLETSGPWIRALGAGRPTVVIDLAQLDHLPTLDPRTWRLHGPANRRAGHASDAVAVAIDILDEDHSLRLAMQRLALDAELRATLGAAARRHWAAEHTPERMTDDYERAITSAAALPAPKAHLPAHLDPDPWAPARTIAGDIDPRLARDIGR